MTQGACLHARSAHVVATYASGALVALEAQASTADAHVAAAAGRASVAAGFAWCGGVVGTGPLSTFAHDCASGHLSFTLDLPGGMRVAFTGTGPCAASSAVSVGPPTNPTPVHVPGTPGTRVGCVGTVTVVFVTGAVLTLPSFSPGCVVSELCAPFVGTPGVAGCTPNPLVPLTPIVVPGTPGVDACLWEQAVLVDVNGDRVPDVTLVTAWVTPGPCP
ncbi:MAG TPA: hypothetical protein VNX21_07520 [Candidatus Thermoplasmatota archaeon]|nr:hypothetical protein [Candidatus Thermoplasmatota archaeon]